MSFEGVPLAEAERLQLMIESVGRGKSHALQSIRLRFENQSEYRRNLAYHNSEHTEGVIRRTEIITRTIASTAPHMAGEREVQIAILAAAFHDTVQEENEPAKGLLGVLKRVRRKGENEQKSAEEALRFMNDENARINKEIFTEVDMADVREAIMGTVPDWDPKNKTVVQSNVGSNSRVVARSVALADLGVGGMEPDGVVDEGRKVFREENLDILDALESGKELSADDKENYRKRFVESAHRQLEFVQGRAARFNQEIEGFPSWTQHGLQGLFSGFPRAFELLRADIARVENMTFEELVREMGYR